MKRQFFTSKKVNQNSLKQIQPTILSQPTRLCPWISLFRINSHEITALFGLCEGTPRWIQQHELTRNSQVGVPQFGVLVEKKFRVFWMFFGFGSTCN